jgi:fatty-acyl-CoA synthase
MQRLIATPSICPSRLCSTSAGLDVCTGYGRNQTPHQRRPSRNRTADGNIDDEIEHRTKTGRVVPLVDLRIIDPEMNELPRDSVAVGEIVLRALVDARLFAQ